jgi:mono/diheme cytochrome c family protein
MNNRWLFINHLSRDLSMRKVVFLLIVSGTSLLVAVSQLSCDKSNAKKTKEEIAMIARGKYLVNIGGCNDCHSPKIMSPSGPIPDPNRLLSGHPTEIQIQDADFHMVTSGNWIMAGRGFTSYMGPWGISFASNLTPDSTSGIGSWDEEMFFKTLREGKYNGNGRDLLPPMPWQSFRNLSDQDLRAIFTYLKSIKPVNNYVPPPVTPEEIAESWKNR